MIRAICTLGFLFWLTIAGAQPKAADFDFWVGDWDAVWPESDTTSGTAQNTITREMNGKVLAEHFRVLSGQNAGFEGQSWSILDVISNTWKQTWVDSQGAYLDFTGGATRDTASFSRQFVSKRGKPVQQKMVFHDIEAERFTWDWMSSKDEGKTWQLDWQIHYTRRKK